MSDILPHAPAPASGEIALRRATRADAEVLGHLAREVFLDTFVRGQPPMYSDFDLEGFLAASHSPAALARMIADPDLAVWVAGSAAGEALAYAVAGPCGLPVKGAAPTHGEIRRFYLAKAAQGSGLADRMMADVLAWLRAEARPVWLGVWSENHRAQRFYARKGFETVAEFDYPVGQTIDREFAMRRGAGPF